MKELLRPAWWWKAFEAFGFRGWLVSGAVTVVALALTATPTAIIENPFFTRMTSVRPQDYVIWIISGLMMGLIAGTFTLPIKACAGGKAVTGGLLSVIATACPICNKVVVLLLGISGALTYFGPAQLYIGIISLALLGWALFLRIKLINSGYGVASRQLEMTGMPLDDKQ